ncbi:hypothetical protein PCANC_15168 [Puccinia coronata f. sp. avenae]|uniref:Uncharacterized protein n=1 Tax=Puccinia coronata f. sp. avenae TaxID=200324 RepID=A0A2N5UJI4_9BASI|nr:hypothetical protein PCANC_15168 [Puccinia coronata f. sp. avenae]
MGETSKQLSANQFSQSMEGLPPKLSNQQYNCHFLSTSNTAGALELADQIVGEINNMGTHGFTAFDYGLQQDVLVMSSVLCVLGDSPMHAEITNTPLPGASLNPCRICHLGVSSRSQKSEADFVYQFLGMDAHGNRGVIDYRSWDENINRSKELWQTELHGSKDNYAKDCKYYGVQDHFSRHLVDIMKSRNEKAEAERIKKLHIDQVLNPFLRLKGFDGCGDTPVEIH